MDSYPRRIRFNPMNKGMLTEQVFAFTMLKNLSAAIGDRSVWEASDPIDTSPRRSRTSSYCVILGYTMNMARFWVPFVVLTAGVAISIGVRIQMLGWERERAGIEFVRRSTNVSNVLSSGIRDYETSIESVKNITSVAIQSSPNLIESGTTNLVGMRQDWTDMKSYFSQMVKDTQKSYPGFQALGWVVASDYSDLKALELGGKFLIAPNYQIHEIGAEGARVPVEPRDRHFPVFYVEPLEDNQMVLGIDLSASTITRVAAQRAMDSGRMVATEPIEFIRTVTGQLGFLAFSPVYFGAREYETKEDRQENLYALAMGIILIEDMLNSSLGGLEEEGIDFFVVPGEEESDGNPIYEEPVYSSNGDPESLLVYKIAALQSGIEWESGVDVMGNTWRLYSYPTEAFLASYESQSANAVSFCGMLITLALVFYLVRSIGYTQHIAHLVAERTTELTQSNEELQREIATRKVAEHDREKLQTQMAQTERMESIGELAGGIAHDFNNLLMGIFGYISMAKEDLPKDHPGHEKLVKAEESMGRATLLTGQLLTFAKGGDPVKDDVDLGPAVEEVVRFALSGSNVSPVIELAGDLWMAKVDLGQVQQVFSNLAINSDQSMPEGGRLYIRLENADISEGEVANLRPGRYIKGSVRDEGMGIDPKFIDRIFEPYFSTKQAGSGLGLATVYSIVHKHGGHISVDSELGKGTTFTLHIPASESPRQSVEETPVDERLTIKRTGRVLILDDDEMVLQVASAMLERDGYSTKSARNGEQATEMYKESMNTGEPFDVLIMDLTIPGGVGGKEAIKDILEFDPDALAIVSSGYADDPVMANYADYGFKGVAVKPYTATNLRKVLREVLEG